MKKFDRAHDVTHRPQQTYQSRLPAGNSETMAALLNQALAHKQITAQVRLSINCLHLTLTGRQVPDQRTAVILACREIRGWSLERIEVIKITGQVEAATEPAWVQGIALSPLVDAPLTLDQAVKGQFGSGENTAARRSAVSTTQQQQPQTWVQPIDREGWKSIGAGLLLATLLLFSGQLTFLFSPFLTLVHELGHTVFAWLFGYPAIPAFDFMHGGGITFYMTERVALLLAVIYCGFGYLFYRYWHNPLTARCLLGGGAVYTLCAFTQLQQILISAMGHGFELLFAGIFLYRAISGFGCRYSIERPLYGMLGFFTVFYDIRFAHGLMFDPVARRVYEQGKGGVLDNDFVHLASQHFRVDLSVVAALFLICCLVTPAVVLGIYRYRRIVMGTVQQMIGA